MKKIFTFLALILSMGLFAQNYVEFTDSEHTYSQDFNTLDAVVPHTGITWTNGTVPLIGWYAVTLMNTATPVEVVAYSTGSPETTSGTGLASLGLNGEVDRALGARIANATGDVAYGVKILNSTSGTINSLAVTYTGEQWTYANPYPQYLDVAYKINATSLANTGYVPVPELKFKSPIYIPGINATFRLNGNLDSTRVAGITHVINVEIPKGEYIFLRWYDVNDPGKSTGDSINSGVDHQLAIDDLTITATIGTNINALLENQIMVFVTSEFLTISGKSELSEIRIYSITGGFVKQRFLYSKISEVPIRELLHGIYLAIVRTKDGHEIVKKFVK
jgi:hypothetical protein